MCEEIRTSLYGERILEKEGNEIKISYNRKRKLEKQSVKMRT